MGSYDRRSFVKASAGVGAGLVAGARRSAGTAQETVDLRIGSWDGVESEPITSKVLDAFQAEHPNIRATFEFNPDAYDEKILTGIAAGNAPDVFLWWNYPGLVARGGVADLTERVAGSSPVDLGLYYQSVIDYLRVGDGIYGLPKDFTPRAFYYNKTLFDEAGIEYPTADWTYEEFQEMAVALTKGEGLEKQYGFYTYEDNYALQGYVWSNGGDFISPDGTTASGYLDSAETIEIIDWYVKLYTELQVAPTSSQSESIGGTGDLFLSGRLAIFDDGRWPQAQFQEAPDLDFGTVLPPTASDGNRVTVLHTSGWSLNPDTAHPDEAWELLKGLASAESHTIIAEEGWALPALPSVAEELGFLEDPIEKTWFDATELATTTACFLRTPNWDRASTEINNALSSAFLGEASVEDALMNVVPIVDRILEEE